MELLRRQRGTRQTLRRDRPPGISGRLLASRFAALVCARPAKSDYYIGALGINHAPNGVDTRRKDDEQIFSGGWVSCCYRHFRKLWARRSADRRRQRFLRQPA